MSTRITVDRYRLRRPGLPGDAVPSDALPGALPVAGPYVAPEAIPAPRVLSRPEEVFDAPDPGILPQDATDDPGLRQIRHEGLSGRQLRLARRLAQLNGLPATSDYDAVRQLRTAGIDPFDRVTVDETVVPEPSRGDARPSTALAPRAEPRLPRQIAPIQVPSTEVRAAEAQVGEIARIQAGLARRRRRKSLLLAARLAVFVLLPTLLMGWYYSAVATPQYEAKSEFVIQTADGTITAGSMGALGGLGGMMEANVDSIAVQGYLQSREAMLQLDRDLGFRAIFQDPAIDPLQRLAPDASDEDAFRVYHRNVSIAYDPTERIVKMTVRAPDPDKAVAISNALIGYAEEQIDRLSQRKREDQMRDARLSYETTQADMAASQRRVVDLQQRYSVLSSEVEVSLITGQIAQLETQLSTDRLSLVQMQSNAQPNEARMEPVRARIAAIEAEIATLRGRMSQGAPGGVSLAQVQSDLLMAQADVQTRQLMLASTLQQLETARIEANRQVRYLSLSVRPSAQDEPAWPRVFENTAVAGLIFAGIYLMIAMTAAILREQISA